MSDIKVEYNLPDSIKSPNLDLGLTDIQMQAYKPWIDMILDPKINDKPPSYTVSIRELFDAFGIPESKYEKHKDYLDCQCYPIASPDQSNNSEVLEYTFEFRMVHNNVEHQWNKTPFVELLRQGRAEHREVDNFIDMWHDGWGEENQGLREFLGFTEKEYEEFLKDADYLYTMVPIKD